MVINKKWKCIFIWMLVFLSLVPTIYLFSYCYATGDDYGYGAIVKQAWNSNHSIIDAIKASCSQVLGVYTSWQGTWFTVFLFAFNPEVFGFGYYWITPVIMLALHIISAWILTKTFFEKKYGLNNLEVCVIAALVFVCNIQFAPSYQCNLFWWVGTVHYVIPFTVGCLAIYNLTQYLKTYKNSNLLFACILFLLLGGGNYQVAIVTPLVLLCYFLWDLTINRIIYKAKALYILLPVIIEMIGLYISIIAPGNKNRGGEQFVFSIGYAMTVILKCFVEAFNSIVAYFTERSFLIVIFLIYSIIMYYIIERRKEKLENWFKNPILMILTTFCLFAASFAPKLYAGVGVSGGVYNTNFYIFVIAIFYDIAYVEGYLILRRNIYNIVRKSILCKAFCLIALIMLVFISRHSIKNTTSYVSYKYIVSGQAEDYKEQMLLQNEILADSSNEDAVVPFINNEQGPLQQMPVTDDPEAWSNSVTALFYGKNSVVAINRDAWYDEFGDAYGY